MVNVSKLSDVLYCQAQRGTYNYTFLPFVDRNKHSVRGKTFFRIISSTTCVLVLFE